ncbi:DUF6313 family protein [Streptomyces sp. NPDC058475]|uniref:DUF6313 family protein n=1 Tax=unclassified Streptomyces TaxID=2593676 RepID=UPI0036568B2C
MTAAHPPPPPRIPPPPAPTRTESIRRWWRSRGQLPKLLYWIGRRGLPLLAVLIALEVLSGVAIGWWKTYELTLGITSPGATPAPWIALPVSMVGWLLVPAVVGGLAGYVVSTQIDSHRRQSAAEALAELRRRSEGVE